MSCWRKCSSIRISSGDPVLHAACFHRSYDVLDHIFIHVREHVEDDALIKQLLTVTNKRGMTLLHFAVYNDNLDITKLILDHVRDDDVLLEEILLHEILINTDQYGNTVLHFACVHERNQFLDHIFRHIKGNGTLIKKLLTVKYNRGRTLLHMAVYEDSLDMTKVILDHVRDDVLLQEMLMNIDEHGDTVLHLACLYGRIKVLEHIFIRIQEKDTVITNLLTVQNNNKMTPLHAAAYKANLDMITRILDHVRDDVLLKKLLMNTDKHKNTVLHILACMQEHDVIFDKVLGRITEKVDLLKKVMKVLNNDGMTILHLACDNAKPDITKVILDNVTDDTLKKMLRQTCNDTSILHTICKKGNDSMLKVILDHVSDESLLEDMIMGTDKHGNTAVHLACIQGQNKGIQCLEVLLQRMRHTSVLNNVMLKKDKGQGRTLLHLACQEGFEGIIDILFRYIHRDEIKKFILAQDKSENTPFYLACAHGNHIGLEALTRLVKDKGLLIKLVQMRSGDMTPIDAIVRSRHFCCVPTLLGGPDEFSKHIIRSDNISRILRDVCTHGENAVVESIMRASCEIERHEKHSMLQRFKETDSNGKGLLHIACSGGNEEILMCILTSLKKMDVVHLATSPGTMRYNNNDNTYSHIQFDQDNNGRTAFHKCCQHGKHRLVKMTCDFISWYYDDEFMAQILCNKSKKGTSPLSEAVDNGHHQTVNVIVSTAVKSKCLKDLLLECKYSNDQTLLHRARHYKYEQVKCLEVVLKKAQEYTDCDTDGNNLIQDICFRKDIYGKTFVSYLAQATEEVLPLLIKLGIEVWKNNGDRSDLVPTLLEAFDNGNHQIVKSIMGEAVSSGCIKKLLLPCTCTETLLHRACYNKHGHTSCMEAVLDAANSCTDDPEVFRKLFLSPDENGRTFLFYLSDSSEDMIRLLVKWAIEWDNRHSVTDPQQSICCQLLHWKNSLDSLDASDASVNADRRECVTYGLTSESRAKCHNQNFNKDPTALQYIKKQKQNSTLSTKISALTAIFDNLDSDDHRQPSDFVLFETKNEDGAVLLHSMCNANCLDLIQHEYTQKYLYACWEAYGRWFFIINMVLYTIMLSILTTFVVSHRFDVNGTSNTDLVFTKASWINPFVIMLILFSILTLVYEILQMIAKGSRYFREPHNYVDLIVCLTSLFLPISSLHIDYNIWHHRIGAMVMCLAWINATWMITRVPSRNDNLFWKILKRIILVFNMLFYVMRRGCFVIPVFTMLTLTFALCFHTLFQTQEPFSTFVNSLLRTIGMTIGELDMVSMFSLDSESGSLSFKSISSILFTIFLYMMTISAMNLLVGMAVGDIKELGDKGEVVAFETLVELILESRRMLPIEMARRTLSKLR